MKRMRSSSPLSTLALALFALYLAVSVPWALLRSARTGLLALRVAGETPFEERSRFFGPDYARGIAAIRRAIPADGAYVLVNGDPGELGGPVWVKFDLAPRRAVFLGTLQDLDNVERLRKRMPRAARWVVIAYGPYRTPVLIERYKLMRQLREKPGA
jgi:hypothetical protein